jgi:hypothetical protein
MSKIKKFKISQVAFCASLLSIIASIVIFPIYPLTGIFVGLWAPTLMSFSNKII